MRQTAKRVMEMCQMCAKFHMQCLVNKLRPIKTQFPLEMVVMDTGYVTFPLGRKENFLAAVDYFTKWAEVRAITSKPGAAVSKFLQEEIIQRHGFPEMLPTDSGSLYVSADIQKEVNKRGLITTPPLPTTQRQILF